MAIVLIRTLVGKGSRVRCTRSCRTGTTVKGRGIWREVHSVTLRIVVVDVGGIKLPVRRRELQTGRAVIYARVIAGSTDRFVKVGVNFVLIATTLLALDEEQNKSADDTKTDQADNSKSTSHGTFVFQEAGEGVSTAVLRLWLHTHCWCCYLFHLWQSLMESSNLS